MAEDNVFGLTAVQQFFVVILGLALLAYVIVIIFGTLSSSDILSSDALSSSTEILAASNVPVTLDPVGLGVDSIVVNAKNQTWLEFDGDDDKILIPNSEESFNLSLSPGFTLYGYVKINDSSESNIIGKGDTGLQRYAIYVNNNYSFVYGFDGVTEYFVSSSDVNKALNYDDYALVVGIYNSSNNMILSTSSDGKMYSSLINITNSGGYYSNRILSVGSQSLGLRANFTGNIDESGMFNESLKIGQVMQLYKKFDNKTFIPVLMHHVLATPADNSYDINISSFIDELDYLNNSGYESITDIEYYNWSIDGGFQMPEKPVMFIWDDARLEITDAARNMSLYGYKGVAAIPTSWINLGGYMNWTNLTSLIDDYDWSIASHSVSHCNFITNCSRVTNWTEEFSDSKSTIIGNLSFTPITFIYPFNSWNISTMEYCRLNYSLCFGSAYSTDIARYIDESSNLSNGELWRVDITNTSINKDFDNILNTTLPNYLFKLNLNENSGTTAYDSSSNGNNGTITGATWADDGVDVALTQNTDFTVSANLFTIINNDYSWSNLSSSWSYSVRHDINEDANSILINTSEGVSGFFSSISPVYAILAVMVIILVLLVLVRVVETKNGATPGL